MIYRLTEAGRAVTWREWRRLGGCGLTAWGTAHVCDAHGPETRWPADLTLGQIADADPAQGRGLARFARDHLRKPEWAEPEKP